jgi:hypothetical protein
MAKIHSGRLQKVVVLLLSIWRSQRQDHRRVDMMIQSRLQTHSLLKDSIAGTNVDVEHDEMVRV